MKTGTTPGRSGRRLARGAVVFAAATVLVASLGLPAYAEYFEGGMPGKGFNYYTDVNPTWTSYFDTGNIRWNQRVGSSIGRNQFSSSSATAGYFGQDWYGRYESRGSRNFNRTFYIRVNVQMLQRDAGSNFGLWCLSTTTHELGHALSLADDPNTAEGSIMYHGRDRTSSQVPTSYDIREVRRIYG